MRRLRTDERCVLCASLGQIMCMVMIVGDERVVEEGKGMLHVGGTG